MSAAPFCNQTQCTRTRDGTPDTDNGQATRVPHQVIFMEMEIIRIRIGTRLEPKLDTARTTAIRAYSGRGATASAETSQRKTKEKATRCGPTVRLGFN